MVAVRHHATQLQSDVQHDMQMGNTVAMNMCA